MLKTRRPRALPQAGPFPRRLAGAGHRHDQARGPRGRALLREARARWATSSATSMSAAASASITTARARPSTARPTTRSPSTRATSSRTSWTCATRRRSRIPTIVSESGRAIVAHHSVLVVEAFGSIEKDTRAHLSRGQRRATRSRSRDMLDLQRNLTQQNRMESLHDAQQIKEQAQSMFDLGLLDLESQGARSRRSTGRSPQRIVDFCAGHEVRAGRGQGTGDRARRPVRLQLLRLPVAARSLGARPALPGHADPSPRTNTPSGRARWSISPATRTARSASSSTCRT